MEYCPYCKKYVNVVIHKYHNELEDTEERRCEYCCKTIVVEHYPKMRLKDKLDKMNYYEGSADEKTCRELLNNANRKMMLGMFPEGDEE